MQLKQVLIPNPSPSQPLDFKQPGSSSDLNFDSPRSIILASDLNPDLKLLLKEDLEGFAAYLPDDLRDSLAVSLDNARKAAGPERDYWQARARVASCLLRRPLEPP